MNDPLTPVDGDASIQFRFDGLQRISAKSAHALISFGIFSNDEGSEERIASLSFVVAPENDGIDGMIARGHDNVIWVLRNALYKLDRARAVHRAAASKISGE